MKSVYVIIIITLVLSGCSKRVESISGSPKQPSKPATPTVTSKPTTLPSSGEKNKPSGCKVSTPPAHLGVDSFYKKYCDANGIPILSSEKVSDRALQRVAAQARLMLVSNPAVVEAMRKGSTKIAIMSSKEVTTDIPEHSDLNKVFPGANWDTRARGLGATAVRPVSSAAEENILCYPNDPYRGEDIFIHEFAHTMHIMGIQKIDVSFPSRLKATYDSAMAKGLWKKTYAASNDFEYWAEGVQSWFNVNLESVPPNGIHNHVNTRAELKAYDAGLYKLIAEYFSEASIPSCNKK